MKPKSQVDYSSSQSPFPDFYRKEIFEFIAQMLRKQQSGVVVGGSGTGKSNISRILANLISFIIPLLPKESKYLFCLVDINKLSEKDPTYFYRGMLRELYKAARRANISVAKEIYQLELDSRQWNDEQFLFFALEDAHDLIINQAGYNLVWLFDRFDKACPILENSTLDALRSLRDEMLFNGRLFYLAFTRKPLQRLRDWSENSELLEILESNTCWVGPMVERDARWNVQQIAQRQGTKIRDFGETCIVELTGGLPAFTKAASELWLKEDILKIVSEQMDRENEVPKDAVKKELQTRLLQQDTIKRTCQEIINDLEPNERQTLKYIASGLQQIGLDWDAVEYLKNHGLIKLHKYIGKSREPEEKWILFSTLFEAYLLSATGRKIITVDNLRRRLLLDDLPMDIHFPPQPYTLAEYMIERPNQALSKDALIEHLWTDGHGREQGLSAAIATLRTLLKKFSTDNGIVPCLGKRIIAKGGCYVFEQKDLAQEHI